VLSPLCLFFSRILGLRELVPMTAPDFGPCGSLFVRKIRNVRVDFHHFVHRMDRGFLFFTAHVPDKSV
jgi:hypothetical protein